MASFRYRNDRFTFSWGALFRSVVGLDNPQPIFKSLNYEYSFSTFADYWQEVGRREALVGYMTKTSGHNSPKAFSEFEVVQKLAKTELGTAPGVVLYDINLNEAARLAERFPGVSASLFIEHMLVLPTKNREAAINLAQALPPSLVRTAAFNDGLYLTDNENI